MMRARRLTMTGLVLLWALALGVSPADAARSQLFESAPFSQPSAFEAPTGVAANQETGNVYVADGGHDVVDVFGAEGGSPAGGVPAQIGAVEGLALTGEPAEVAVDNDPSSPSHGDVYVAESSARVIAKFKLNTSKHEYEPAGTLVVAGAFEPNGVAVDTEGNVYLADYYKQAIAEFNSSGTKVGEIKQSIVTHPAYVAVGAPGVVYVGNYDGGVVAKVEVNPITDVVAHEEALGEAGGGTAVAGKAVAVDSHGNVYVDAESHISEYSPLGALSEEFGSGFFAESKGVAVNGTSGDVYVTNRAEANLVVFGPPGAVIGPAPVVSTGPPSAETATTATVTGKVNPAGTGTKYWFQYGPTEAYGSETKHESAGEGAAAVTVTAGLTVLQPDTTYHYRLVARNAFGELVEGHDETFTTSPAPPKVDSESTSGIKSTAATLEAQVNANNEATTYSFEYATNEALTSATSVGGSLAAAGGDQLANVTLSGLKAGETYYYRVVAENAQSKKEGVPVRGAVQSFTTVPAPATGAVTAITATTATFNGELAPLNRSVQTEFLFEYNVGVECTGGSSTPTENAGTAPPATKVVSVAVVELQPHTTYSVCLASSNAFGFEVDPASPPVHFTTVSLPPKIDSETSSSVTSTEATLEAQVNPNNQEAHAYLQYSTSATVNGSGSLTGATPTPTPPGPEVGSNYEDHPLGPFLLTGLTADQTYYYQAVAVNATGTTYGAVRSFTTQGAPLLGAAEAHNTTRSTAALSGTVNPTGLQTTYYFAYISAAGYQAALAAGANPYAEGATTSPTVSSSDEPQALQALATGLLPETTYHYALVAGNDAGTVTGPDMTFTTGAGTPPIVTTGGASNITDSAATLSGELNTQGLAVSYAFEVSTDPGNYGFPTGAGTVNIGVSVANVTTGLQGLQPGTTYYYRVLATSLDGTSYGVGQSFTTPGFPSLISPSATPGLIATPAVAFPKEEKGSSTATPKALTKAQKLAAALKVCKRKPKHKRAACQKQAHKRYPSVKKKKK